MTRRNVLCDSGFGFAFAIGAVMALIALPEYIRRLSSLFSRDSLHGADLYVVLTLTIGHIAWFLWLFPAILMLRPLTKQRISEASLIAVTIFTILGIPLVVFIWPFYIWNLFVVIFLIGKISHMRELRGIK